MSRLALRSWLVLAVLMIAVGVGRAQGPQPPGMPNPMDMSGVPLPSADLPAGTITVRVIRGSLTSPVTSHRVDLTGGVTASANTNEMGRAEFPGLTPGVRVKAVTTVDGTALASEEFAVPPAGGIRVMLVAPDPETAKRQEQDRILASGPSRSGIVVLGNQSRFVFEFGEDGLNVFNILEIQNTARTPVDPMVPLVFDLPQGAEDASVLEGSSPLASVAGRRVTVRGPIPPGTTLVQFAYTVRYAGSTATVRQRLPAALSQVMIAAQTTPGLTVTSPQIAQQQTMTAEGQTYIVGQGGPLGAGSDVVVTFSGLPHPPTWPRNIALALALLILAGGAVAAFRRGPALDAGAERTRLEEERDRLFVRLEALDASHQGGSVDPQTYVEERRSLIAALQRVYAALDDQVAA